MGMYKKYRTRYQDHSGLCANLNDFYPKIYWKYHITAKFCPIYDTAYCHGVLNQTEYSNYKKELLELLHAVSIMPIRNHYLKRLICSKLKISRKQKHWSYIIDTNKMNFQNILNQCSLNQMIFIHMILDISLFYINYQQRQALDGYV